MKVFINPGHALHGTPDPGAVNVNTGLREADVTAAVGELVAEYLVEAGFEVCIMQDDDLEAVVDTANEAEADIFVSIHCNASGNSVAEGTESWYCYGDTDGEFLAEFINDQIVDSVGTWDRGVKCAVPGENGLYVLTNTDMPAVLVEMAFISNYADEERLEERQDEFARAIARGITDYLQ